MDPFLDSQVQNAFLRHPAITSEQQLLCSLLLTSKASRYAVLSACPGLASISLACTEKQQQKPLQLASWLRSHASLVRSLRLDLQLQICYGFDWKEAVAAIASAFDHAAAAGALQLQECDISRVKASAPILAALPTTLTSLSCWVEYNGPELGILLGLTALRRLKLDYTAGYDNVALQLPVKLQDYTALEPLSALQQLTHLSLKSIRPAHLQHLPAQLRELSADVMGSPFVGEAKQYLQLQHMTALTMLESTADLMGHRVCEGDMLPPHLQWLIWPDIDGCVGPLLQLSSLQQLQLHYCWTTPVDQLHQLSSSLHRLTILQLAYSSGKALKGLARGLAAASAAGLACLRTLTIDLSRHSGFGCGPCIAGGTEEACVPWAVVRELDKLQGLTSLVMKGLPRRKSIRPPKSQSVLQASVEQLTSVLGRLTALQHLQLEGFDRLEEAYVFFVRGPPSALMGALEPALSQGAYASGSGAAEQQQVAEFVQTIVGLSSLRSLSLTIPLQLSSQHVQELAAATQLTSLRVWLDSSSAGTWG